MTADGPSKYFPASPLSCRIPLARAGESRGCAVESWLYNNSIAAYITDQLHIGPYSAQTPAPAF